MTTQELTLHLLSDTTFGRGDGLAGVVDAEVQHDDYGLPYLSGKTLKGLLGAECAEVLFALRQKNGRDMIPWEQAAARLFGGPGSTEAETGQMHVGDACLPASLRGALAAEFAPLSKTAQGRQQRANLESLTAVRRQTAMEAETGAPKKNTLRTMRVILRDIRFTATLTFSFEIDRAEYVLDRALLAACVKAFRRAGAGRNRGRGRLRAELSADWFALFEQEARK
jgi:hypothetical protein